MNISIISSNELESSITKEFNNSFMDYYLANENVKGSSFGRKEFLDIFNYSCNLMKEIESGKKDEGLNIMEKLIEFNE